ncbi:MAG: NAD(P)H-dependent oxidoreductase [Leptospiraceae bacterium]|nr:NAD(P)H-dependent oxidoreductase [Leptospiraceae bacterium]MDW7976332.1 NAD(P)H-dependent oxidoreductase [Leptospiraceae bacterium]
MKLLEDVYLEPEKILEVLNFRHACKKFDPDKKILEKHWDVILESGRLSPSSFGLEPWKFLVIQNPKMREELIPACWGAKTQFLTASHVVAILARKNVRWDSEYLLSHMKEVRKLDAESIKSRIERIRSFQETQFELLSSPTALWEWSVRQSYIALANMMTIAALLKIDSCAIEGFNRKNAQEIIKNWYDVSWDEWGLAAFVAFGYRVENPGKKARWPREKVIDQIE